MPRTDHRLRAAHNRLLNDCAGLGPGAALPSEARLAETLGVSRSIVRGVLSEFGRRGLLHWKGREKVLLRPPGPADRLATREETAPDALERRFLDWILRFDVPPGTALNMTQLARDLGVTPRGLAEFLSGWSRFGLVERRPRGGWRLMGFTAEFAVELSDLRTLLEIDAVRHLVTLPPAHPLWAEMDGLREDHLDLLERIDRDFHDFSRLDQRFHATVTGVVRNRFIAEFQKVVSLIFHYHYQWDKADERQRNEAATLEHLRWIEAMQARDGAAAEHAARAHLATSKQTLLASLRAHHLGQSEA